MNIEQLLDTFQALHIKKRNGATFLEIARFPHRETVWSNILAFYLDSNREHGLHDLLLKSVLEAMGKEEPELSGLLRSLHGLRVQTEVITSKGKRLDLLVTSEQFVLGIENKVLASLYNDLEDYGALLDQRADGQVTAYKVVLSRYATQPTHGFVNLTYAQLVKTVRQNLGAYTDFVDAKYLLFLLDFLKTIEKHHNRSALMENLDVLNLLENNAAVVEELVKHHQAYQAELVGKMDRVDQLLVSRLYTGDESLAALLVGRGGSLRGQGNGNKSSRFTWQTSPLMKYYLQMQGTKVIFQVGIIKGYRLRAHFWVEGNEQLIHRLTAAGVDEQYFSLKTSDEEMADTLEQQLRQLVECL